MIIRIHDIETKTFYDISNIQQAKVPLDKMIYIGLIANPKMSSLCCGKTVGEVLRKVSI